MTNKAPPSLSVDPPKIPGGTSVACLFTWLGTKGDYSSIDRRNKALTGWRRQLSSVTKEGRLNIVIGTYVMAAVGGVLLWKAYRPSKETQSQD